MNHKKITFIFAAGIIVCLICYSAFLIGTLTHELVHKSNAINPVALYINYDGTGEMQADYFIDDTESYAYLAGNIIMVALTLIGLFSFAVVVQYCKE